MNKDERIYQIDLYRFIAAMGVLSAHYLFRGFKADNLTNLNLLDLGGEWVKYCFVFIDLFFIISGFVIALSVKNKSLNHFFKSRVMRIFSVYWICVSITYLVTEFYGAPWFTATFSQFLINLSLLQDFLNVPSLDGAYWTMSVELRFYCLAMVYLFLYRYRKIKIITLAYWWLIVSILQLLVQDYFIIKVLNLFLMFQWSSAFVAGIIMGEISKTKKVTTIQSIGLLGCLILSIYHRLIYIEEARLYFKTDISDYISIIAILTVYVIMLAAVLGKMKWLNKPYFLTLGLITYPLYLLHQHIGYIIFNTLMYDMNKYVLLGGTVLLMILSSYIIVRWVAPPISSFLDIVLDKVIRLITKIKWLLKPLIPRNLKSLLKAGKNNVL